MLLAVAAVLLFSPDLVVAAWAGAAFMAVQVQGRLEEEFLAAKSPDYAQYASRTGRFLPKSF